MVLDVRKYEPVVPTGSIYNKTDKRFTIFVEDIRHNKVHESLSPEDGGTGRLVLDIKCKNDILVRLVPRGVASAVMAKKDADAAMATGACALMGKGIEVAFDFDAKPQWCHGEVVGVTSDKIRVLYYDSRERIWHSRFKMPQYGKLKSPIQNAGKKALSDYYWRLIN